MKDKLYICLLCALCAYSHSFAQNASFKSVVEKATPFSNVSVKLEDSWVKHREELNTEYLKSLDPDRLLHNFRVNAGLPSDSQPLEGWESPGIGLRGHFVGHYLSALSGMVEKNKDPLFADRIDYMVDELFKCQEVLGNGYLSAFPERDFDTLEAIFTGVWAPYYTYHKIMQGLLDVYNRTGNKKSYDMVVGMAGYVGKRMAKLDEATIEKMLYSAGANPQNEAGAMNEVLYRLYKATDDPEHLLLAQLFDRDWFLKPLSENKNILSGLHSNTHLVLVNGFAECYSITQKKQYYDAVLNFWNMLMSNHVYANGSSSGPRPNVTTHTSLTAEHWGVPGQLSNTMTREIAETCVSHNTQKLTSNLFSWSADPVYADAYMNTFYNSVLALQSAHTGACVYHLPLGSPRRKLFLKENDFRCCNGTSIEAFSSLNSGIYYHDDSNLWVNLYVPSTVKWAEKGLSIKQAGEFPMERAIEFTISAKKKTDFALNLFIPSWAANAEVFINGEKCTASITPSSYVNLSRTWKEGDKVKLVFDYDFYTKAMPDDENVVAIFYGPILLAFEGNSELILRGKHEDVLNNIKPVNGDNSEFHLLDGGKEYLLKPLYAIENEIYGVYATFREY